MPIVRRKRSFSAFFEIARPWIWGGLGLIALGFFFYFLTGLGPRHVSTAVVAAAKADDPAITKLSAEVVDLEKRYHLTVDAGVLSAEAMELLVAAVDKQREVVRLDPLGSYDQSSRLQRLETELDNARAKQKAARIEQLEKDGNDGIALGTPEGAAMASASFAEALKLQREINGSEAGSRYKNYVKETSYGQALSALDAAPLHKEMEAAREAARKATAQERWGEALVAYTTARDVQARINREYGRTRFADLGEADRLDAEIESLNAAGLVGEITAKEKAGDTALKEKRFPEAAEAFAAAFELQKQVNQSFTKSRFVSSQRIELLETKRQTALSSPQADALAQLDEAISDHLRKRQVVAAEQKIVEAGRLVERLFADYPKSARLDPARKLKLAYLALRRADLRALQDEAYERLLPLPGVAERLMLKTEVPQSLYVLVMTSNPSRNPGRSLPVDSVNWTDAQEFCMRLSWMLGATARLPKADEMRVALGDGELGAWSKQNSEGRSRETGRQKPNTAGFYDLLGNLAEWVAAESDTDKALVVGGSYLDAPEVLLAVPNESRYKSDRARHVGFRVLVELAAP